MKNQNQITDFELGYYFHLNKERQNLKTQLFIDSRDVIQILLGVKNFTSFGRFDEKTFKSDATLMQSLIYGNWLGSFKLLIPHQDELLYNLEKTQIFPEEITVKEQEELLYHFVRLNNLEKGQITKKTSSEDILKLLQKPAKDLYKIQYLLNQPNWRKRLNHLRSKGILQLDKEQHDFVKLSKLELYSKLKSGFSKQRPGQRNKKRNIVDALILCILHEKLKRYKNGESDYIPIYYDAHNLFFEVIQRTNTNDEFAFSIKRQKISIIQAPNFFLIQALLSKEKEVHPLISDNNIAVYKKFQEISGKIKQRVNINPFNPIEEKLKKDIENFIDTQFIDIFWVNREKETIDFVNNFVKHLKGQKVQKHIDEELKEYKKAIREHIKEYDIFREVFYVLEKGYNNLQKRFTENLDKYLQENEIDVFTVFALTRFSINPKICKPIRDLSNNLFLNTEDGNNLSIILTAVVENISIGLFQDDQDKLVIGIAILWILEEYGLVVKILDKLNLEFTHFGQALFYAAAVAKKEGGSDEGIDKVLHILKCINENHGDEFCFVNNYKTAIGASYVYYFLWRKNSRDHFLTNLRESSIKQDKNRVDTFLEKAIKLAEVSIKFLKSKMVESPYRKIKYYYILNNYIYYLTIGSSNKDFKKLEDYVNVFADVKINNPEYWQYRFDDTLAIYYLRLALIEIESNKNKIAFNNHINKAQERIEYALDHVLIHEEKKLFISTKQKINDIQSKYANA